VNLLLGYDSTRFPWKMEHSHWAEADAALTKLIAGGAAVWTRTPSRTSCARTTQHPRTHRPLLRGDGFGDGFGGDFSLVGRSTGGTSGPVV